MLNSPILLITFNRPNTTLKVLDAIKNARPTKLYVFNDGPRIGNPNDMELCKEVRKIVQEEEWDFTPKYYFSNTNLGCKAGVVKAISWVFEKEDRVIIVEDDVVPVVSFFYFAEEMLEKYKNDERIAMISGNNYTPINSIDSDYYFSRYGHIWGWATWKRIWDKFDVNVPDLKQAIQTGLLDSLTSGRRERNYLNFYFKLLLKEISNNTNNAWGPSFFYFRVRNNLLSIVPKVNLCTNIGFEGTHNTGKDDAHLWPTDKNFILKKYPSSVRCNIKYDKYHFNKHINKERPLYLYERILRKAVKIFKYF
jgi:hypothetical protein